MTVLLIPGKLNVDSSDIEDLSLIEIVKFDAIVVDRRGGGGNSDDERSFQ